MAGASPAAFHCTLQNVMTPPPTRAKRRRKAKTPGGVRINLDGCKYDVLRRVAASLHWTVTGEDRPFHLLWSDCSVTAERVMKLVTGQVSSFTPLRVLDLLEPSRPAVGLLCRRSTISVECLNSVGRRTWQGTCLRWQHDCQSYMVLCLALTSCQRKPWSCSGMSRQARRRVKPGFLSQTQGAKVEASSWFRNPNSLSRFATIL
jgi:hypothetical protein